VSRKIIEPIIEINARGIVPVDGARSALTAGGVIDDVVVGVPQSTVDAHLPLKLDALTSLRFGAAFSVYLYHLSQMFSFYDNSVLRGIAMMQGVSFFFILSGFILAYVHSDVKSAAQADRFMLARFARIWPTHFAAFLLTVMMVPPVLSIPNVWLVGAANLALIQSWFFTPWVCSSFNNVSWTISIELFFYLSFPFLIKDFYKPVKMRWIAASLLSLCCFVIYAFMCELSTSHVSSGVYVFENPFARLGEFMLGMFTCFLFKNYRLPRRLGRNAVTMLECSILVLVAIMLEIGNLWAGPQHQGALWAMHTLTIQMGGAPFAAMLIYVIAHERGLVSQFLKRRVMVRLGEVSFALYMVHMTILNNAIQFQNHFANLPGFVLPGIATLLCFIAADLCHSLIESPCRRFVLSFGKSQKNVEVTASGADRAGSGIAKIWHIWQIWHKNMRLPICAAEATALIALSVWMTTEFRFVPPASARGTVSHSIPSARDLEFADRFKLDGLKLSRKADGLHVESVWQSLGSQKLTCGTVMTVRNARGEKLSSVMFVQDNFARSAVAGQLWQDKFIVPEAQLKDAVVISMSLYDPIGHKLLPFKNASNSVAATELALSIP
jgi:peptidoglycan/LPS O-acetylase OafA/YrhL